MDLRRGTSSKVVSLRFRYGVIVDDPLGVLRGGTSTLVNRDFPLDDPSAVDAAAISPYVRDAVAKSETYQADPETITAEAKAGNLPRPS